MDEVIFRSAQKMESAQIKAEMVASKAKDLFHEYTQQSKALLLQVWNSTKVDQLKHNIKEFVTHLISILKNCKHHLTDIIDPRRIYMFLGSVFGKKWTKRDITFACAGFLLGGLIGVAVGLSIKKREPLVRYMEAVQCNHYLGPESVVVVEDAVAPYECGDHDILVNVKAASVHIIDVAICHGYGRNFRRILRRLHKQSTSDLPVILGRDCTGIVTDLGRKVTRLEVGDEVWVTVPFWSQGTLSQSVLVHESRVARKPKNIGFEGACSLPYAGSLAFSLLAEAGVNDESAHSKKILIQGGCTPTGCVLIQLLTHWNAHVTATCYKRALPVAKALGALDVILLSDDLCVTDSEVKNNVNHAENSVEEESPAQQAKNLLFKELEVRNQQFDLIVVTKDLKFDWSELGVFCAKNGQVLSTLPPVLRSDSCGILGRFLLEVYVRLKFTMQQTLGLPHTDFDETHLCHVTLDKLSEYVEDGYLQTVVDKVFHPHDIEMALNHIQTAHSIGSTVITFR